MPAKPDEVLIKALVRAWRWRKMLEGGKVKSIGQLAKQEGLTDSFVCRRLRLAYLAPDIMEVIIAGTQPPNLTIKQLEKSLPLSWQEQRQALNLIQK